MCIIYDYFCFVLEGQLRHSPEMKPMAMAELLKKRYKWDAHKAEGFANFLLPMLEYDPKKRATASQCLKHPWLTGGHSVVTPKDAVKEDAVKEDAVKGDAVKDDAVKEDAEVTGTGMEVQLDEKKDLDETERMDLAVDKLGTAVDGERDRKAGVIPRKDGDQHGNEEKHGKEEEKHGKVEDICGKEEEKHGKAAEKRGRVEENQENDGAEQLKGDGKGQETMLEKDDMEGWRQKMAEERSGTDVEMPLKEGVR